MKMKVADFHLMAYWNKTIESERVYSKQAESIIDMIYTIIITVGLLLNTVTVALTLHNRLLRVPLFVLIFNICIADIIIGISTLPYIYVDVMKMKTDSVILNKLLCSVTFAKGGRFCSLCVQILTFCLLNIHRFILIKYPNRTKLHMSLKNAKLFAKVIWVTSFFLTLPNFLPLTLDTKADICYRDWSQTSASLSVLYKIITFGIGFVLPTVVIAMMILLSLRYGKRLNQVSPREVVLCTRPSVRRARKRLWEYLFPLLVGYYMCLGPILIYFFFTSFIKPISNTIDAHIRNQQYVKIIDIFTTCSIITDPLIYFVKIGVSKNMSAILIK